MKKDRLDAAAPKDIGGGDTIGKFGSPEELLSAYNALQSEFTKRCQLVKELQARLDAFAHRRRTPRRGRRRSAAAVIRLPNSVRTRVISFRTARSNIAPRTARA